MCVHYRCMASSETRPCGNPHTEIVFFGGSLNRNTLDTPAGKNRNKGNLLQALLVRLILPLSWHIFHTSADTTRTDTLTDIITTAAVATTPATAAAATTTVPSLPPPLSSPRSPPPPPPPLPTNITTTTPLLLNR